MTLREHDETLIKWIASFPPSIKNIPTLTEMQQKLGMSKNLLIMANRVFDFGPFEEPFDSVHQNRFAKLQESYQTYFNLNNESKQNFIQVLRLSPRMSIKDENERILLKQHFTDYLESLAKKAEKALRETLSNEEELFQAHLKKKEKMREKKKKRKKKKNGELIDSGISEEGKDHLPVSDGDKLVAMDKAKRENNENNTEVSKDEKKNGSNNADDENILAMKQQGNSKELSGTFPRYLSTKVDQSGDKARSSFHLNSVTSFQNRNKEMDCKAQQKFYTESIQQAQLKAYIADTKAMAAEERSENLESLLKEVLRNEKVVCAMSDELRDKIIKMVRIDCTKVTYS